MFINIVLVQQQRPTPHAHQTQIPAAAMSVPTSVTANAPTNAPSNPPNNPPNNPPSNPPAIDQVF